MHSRPFCFRCRKCTCALYSTTWPSEDVRVLYYDHVAVRKRKTFVCYDFPWLSCLQCQASVPLKLKLCKCCQHVFQSKRKAEYSLSDQATKRMRVSKATKRASETSEQTLHRQQQDRKCKTSTRANETSEQSVHRKHVICQRH